MVKKTKQQETEAIEHIKMTNTIFGLKILWVKELIIAANSVAPKSFQDAFLNLSYIVDASTVTLVPPILPYFKKYII